MQLRFALTALVALAAFSCSDNDDPTGGGEVPLTFSANLTGAAERPDPVQTDATGTASITVTTGSSDVYDPDSDDVTVVTYSVTVSGLSGPASSAHIHGPADDTETAGPIVPLTITGTSTDGVIISGSFTSTGHATISVDSLLVLMQNGSSYLNVHTDANQAGEIRGRIQQQP